MRAWTGGAGGSENPRGGRPGRPEGPRRPRGRGAGRAVAGVGVPWGGRARGGGSLVPACGSGAASVGPELGVATAQ